MPTETMHVYNFQRDTPLPYILIDSHMPNTPSDVFNEELDTITKNVVQSLDRSGNREKGSSSEQSDSQREEAMRSIRESLATMTGHRQKTVVPPPMRQEGTADTDHLSGVDEAYREKISSLLEETYSGGIVRAVNRALKENDPFLVDLYHDTMAQEIYQRLTDQDIV